MGDGTTEGARPGAARKPAQQDEAAKRVAPGTWHLSSLELKEGLTVIDDEFDTIPANLFDI